MRRKRFSRSALETFIYDVAGTTFEGVGREVGVHGTTIARIARGDVTDIKAKTYEALLGWADRVATERNLPPSRRLRWTLKEENVGGDGAGATAV